MTTVDAEPRRSWTTNRPNVLAEVPAWESETFAAALHPRTARRGELLIGPDAAGDCVYLIESGTVRIYRRGQHGREVTIAILRAGHVFGVAALSGVERHATYARALEMTRLREATADEFLGLVRHSPSFAERVVRILARQLLAFQDDMERLALEDVDVRLANVLVRLAEDHSGQLPPRLTHDEVARLTGTTRATATKVLTRFAEGGLITRGYRRLAIADLAGLRRAAGLAPAPRSEV